MAATIQTQFVNQRSSPQSSPPLSTSKTKAVALENIPRGPIDKIARPVKGNLDNSGMFINICFIILLTISLTITIIRLLS